MKLLGSVSYRDSTATISVLKPRSVLFTLRTSCLILKRLTRLASARNFREGKHLLIFEPNGRANILQIGMGLPRFGQRVVGIWVEP